MAATLYWIGPESRVYHDRPDCPALRGPYRYWPIHSTKGRRSTFNPPLPTGRRLCKLCERAEPLGSTSAAGHPVYPAIEDRVGASDRPRRPSIRAERLGRARVVRKGRHQVQCGSSPKGAPPVCEAGGARLFQRGALPLGDMSIDLHSPQELRDALHKSEQEVARLEAILETIFEAAKHPSDNALYNTVKHIERENRAWIELGAER